VGQDVILRRIVNPPALRRLVPRATSRKEFGEKMKAGAVMMLTVMPNGPVHGQEPQPLPKHHMKKATQRDLLPGALEMMFLRTLKRQAPHR
jgi:hypothetical protein